MIKNKKKDQKQITNKLLKNNNNNITPYLSFHSIISILCESMDGKISM